MKILVLNVGSSTLKCCLYEITPDAIPAEAPAPLWEGRVDWSKNGDSATIDVKTAGGVKVNQQISVKSPLESIVAVGRSLWTGPAQVINGPDEIDVVGHRVVHGGAVFRESTPITSQVKAAIAQLSEFAPAHNPAALRLIELMELVLDSKVPQVAVFDTAFHSTLPLAAQVYAVPYDWYERGMRRYGFHGISHHYVSTRAAAVLKRDPAVLRLVLCHLGNGASVCAVRHGISVDTSMGVTPLEGLVMGTRSGSIDPGLLLNVLRMGKLSENDLDHILNFESGLKGVSGISGDMRHILTAMNDNNERAKLAFEVYVHRLRSYIGAMATSAGGMDALVFTAGVGENSPEVREAVCEGLEFLGVKLDPEKNKSRKADEDVAAAGSPVRILVLHTEEDWQIALECLRVAGPKAA